MMPIRTYPVVGVTLEDTFIKDITSRPEDFSADARILTDRKTDRKWWIANGPGYFGLYAPISVKVAGFFARRRCWHHVGLWMHDYIARNTHDRLKD